MRQFTDSEMDDLAAGWRRYKSEYETEPTHIWPFEHGFRVGLDHAAAQLAALTAERNSLRAVCELAFDYVAAEYNDGTPGDPRPRRGEYEELDKLSSQLAEVLK